MKLDLGKKLNNVKKKLNEYKRVLKIAEKPGREEFLMSAKVTGAGTVLIGTIGLTFYLVANLLPQYI